MFDIVTVEGEGCSAAGWEEMSEGDTERITDGISRDDRAFAGFPRRFRMVSNNSSLQKKHLDFMKSEQASSQGHTNR